MSTFPKLPEAISQWDGEIIKEAEAASKEEEVVEEAVEVEESLTILVQELPLPQFHNRN